jgi:hypothetical protein
LCAAAQPDPVTTIFAADNTGSTRDLSRIQFLLAEPCGPVWRQHTVRSTGYRVFIDTERRGEES